MPRWITAILVACLSLFSAACASNVAQVESLSRYDRLSPGERSLLPVREFADAEALVDVQRVYIEPAVISADVLAASEASEAGFARLQTTLSGTMCRRLARGGFEVVLAPDVAAHRLVMTVTGFEPTNPVSAGASGVIGTFVPGPLSPRLPVGIGALAAEAELFDPAGEQAAALQMDVRNHLASGAGTISLLRGDIGETSDARDLARSFADAFGDLLVEARETGGGGRRETPRGTCDPLFDGGAEDETADAD